MIDVDDFLEEPEEDKSDPEAFEAGKSKVRERCKAAGIPAEETEGFEEGSS